MKTTLKTCLTLSLLALSTTTFADCLKVNKDRYTKVELSPSGQCVAVLEAGDPRAENPLDGDLYWLGNGTEKVRIGSEPHSFVTLDNGVVASYHNGKYVNIQSWNKNTKTFKTCKDKILQKDIKTGKASLTPVLGKGITFRDQTISKTYFQDCKDTGKEVVFSDLSQGDIKILEKYSPYNHMSNDLTNPSVNATLPEIKGRDGIVDKMIARLKNDSKRSTLLWGPAGVGKTAIAYRLATRITRGEVPEWFKDWKVFIIDLGSMGSEGLSGVAEQKMMEVVKAASGKKVVLVMDEIHQLISIGTAKGDSTDITEVMKTNLANGQLAIIGTLTDNKNEMALLRTKKAFFSRFTRLKVESPDKNVLMEIYRYKAAKSLKRNKVQFSEDILKNVIDLTKQYVPGEHHPRIGITMIELLSSEKKSENGKVYNVTLSDLKNTIAEYANVSILKGSSDEGKDNSFEDLVWNFHKNIRKSYVGQNKAVEAIQNELLTWAAGVEERNRPTIFLFLGPSGVGKSYLAKQTSKMFNLPYQLYGMSNFTEENDINTLLGSPDGYVGYNPAGGELIQWLNNNPNSSVIFDEIDKAHPNILNSMINLMEEGEISGKSGGAKATLKNGFLFFTSNYGMDLIDAYDIHRLGIKDNTNSFGKNIPLHMIPKNEDELKDTILNKLIKDKKFGTYFAGRINKDNIIIFHHLKPEEAQKIAKIEVSRIKKKMKKINIEVHESVIQFIGKQGLDFRFGARGIRSMTETHIQKKVSKKIVELKMLAKREGKSLKDNIKYLVRMNFRKTATIVTAVEDK